MPIPVEIRTRLERWKRQLIDLTRRNRLLNYRPTKVSTVEIVDELPQQVVEHLLDGKAFYFDPRPEDQEDEDSKTEGDNEQPSERLRKGRKPDQGKHFPQRQDRSQEGSRESDSEGSDEARGEDGAEENRLDRRGSSIRRTRGRVLDQHYVDDRLQTPHSSKVLDRNLVRIHRAAESSLEEQGVNTLFLAVGMLEWYEDRASDQVNRAPILLVPVSLYRDDASSPFRLFLGDDEPVLNPALEERLRHDFQLTLPDLPELSEDIDFDNLFFGVQEAVEGFPRWKVTNDMALGLFSFQKFIMYRDMEKHEEHYAGHELIQGLCGLGDTDPTQGLPPDVRDADLDVEMAPWKTVQVLDADSSQQRAMLAVRKGHHLVIEGPPGTGKSQTIANVIVDVLAEGKTVLFVSEKMAALEVVQSRLEAVSLGDFCLELHSHKMGKTDFVRSLAESLGASASSPGPDDETRLQRLERLTRELRSYTESLHRPFDPLGKSPFQGIDELAAVQEAPLVSVDVPEVQAITGEEYEYALSRLRAFASALKVTGLPREHPFRGCRLTRGGRTTRAKLQSSLEGTSEVLDELIRAARELAEKVGFTRPETFGDVALLLEGAEVIAGSPGAEHTVLQNARWNELSSDVEALLETGAKYRSMRSDLSDMVLVRAFEDDLGRDLEDFEHYVESGWLRFFTPGYWKLRGQLKRCLNPSFKPDDGDRGLLSTLKKGQRVRELRMQIQEQQDLGEELFGGRWDGPASDWEDLREFAEWVVQVRQYALKEALTARGFDIAAEGRGDLDEVRGSQREIAKQLEDSRAAIRNLIEAGDLDPEVSEVAADAGSSLEEVSERLNAMTEGLGRLRDWTHLQSAYQDLASGVAGPFVEHLMSNEIGSEFVVPAFQRVFFRHWLDFVMEERPELGRFRAEAHESRISDFRRIDQTSKEIARRRAGASLLSRRENLLRDLPHQLQVLQREARKSRRIKPVRRVLREAADAIQVVTPCLMMSPLSVAQYVDPEVMNFDLVIFDEASQITPADAVGAIVRGEQAVVVGDSKQLPPTNFFSVQVEEADDLDPEVEDVMVIEDDLESILDEVATAGVPRLRLKWHYRSEDESLIRFSNEEYYSDDPLYTFPSARQDDDLLGLKFEYLPEACYEGGGINEREADVVADAVVDHIKEYPGLSLGIGTFGIKQQTLIQDKLDERRRSDPSIEFFFHGESDEKFFVKNLENIQGDDRDVIFLSVTYGPNRDGNIRRNFGPINKSNGGRRLNVITTRAKKCLRVFSSMRGEDIDLSGGIAPGVAQLQRYLKYAETGEYPQRQTDGGEPDSEFERQVIRGLQDRGYNVIPQVGEAGYRIDIGVLDPESPGRFLCGIECDGASYHSAATVRDRDRLRQQVLELRGWTIHRVWSTDWFYDPEAQIERLVRLLEEDKSRSEERRAREADDARRVSVPKDVPRAEPDHREAPGASDPGIGQGLQDDSKPSLESIELQPYEFAEPSEVRPSEDFYEGSVASVAHVAREVLTIESPIHEEELSRRVAAWYGMQRIGSRIREKVGRAIKHLEGKKRARTRGEFVWLRGQEDVPVRSRAIDGVRFQAEHLPPQEIKEAIKVLLQHRAPLLPDEIVPETARLLGFQRTGSRLSSVIQTALDALIEAEELRAVPLGVELANSRGESEVVTEEPATPIDSEPEEPERNQDFTSVPSVESDWRWWEKKSDGSDASDRASSPSGEGEGNEDICPICGREVDELITMRGKPICKDCSRELR